MKAVVASMALLSALVFTSSAQIVITEIHYHPVEEPAFNADGTPKIDLTHDVHEFVEIQNTGASTMDLGNWKLSGGISYTFPSNTTIGAGAFRVIAKDPARLAVVYSLAASNVLGPYSGQLGNNGDTVRVRDAADNVIDAVTYDSKFPWAGSADALGAQDRFLGLSSSNYQYKGRSLQRVSVTWPSGDPANWLASPLTGPTPDGPQAVTRAVPKPVVVAQSAVQTTDGAVIVRANNAVTVNCTFSATSALSGVTLEYFVDLVSSTTETRSSVVMTSLGGGKYTASIPGKPDRSIVRYRFKADRGDGLEVVSPRADDPQIAPIGANGVREAWHGYFVTPVRSSPNPTYDVFVSSTALSQLSKNITQNPRRVTAARETGLPREVPYVKPTDPLWDGTQPGVFAADGKVWDIQIRYHGSLYQRAAANKSFKVHFPDHQPFNNQTAWFETGHGTEFIQAQKINRLLGLPSSKMRVVDWYFNTDGVIQRSEQGEYAGEMLDEYHKLQQQLNPGSAREENGELYKAVGHNEDTMLEGPYGKADAAALPANAGWTELQRYHWTYALQDHDWKGPKPVRDMITSMWAARGDSPSAPNMNTAAVRAWFTNNFDIDTTLTSQALLSWMGVWDDAGQNYFFWRRANQLWVWLGWDYDAVMFTSYTNLSIYDAEDGGHEFFGTQWWKDSFYKAFRAEYNQRLWELNNSFFDPTNLTAQGLDWAASFAPPRCGYINSQLAALGPYYKPDRPSNVAPPSGSVVITPTTLDTSDYSHPQSADHAATKWEIRTASGDYEEPLLRVTSTSRKTSFPIPFDQLTYGQTYYWRATHIDTNGHPSVVSAETSFSWGTSSTAAGTLVLNEILASNHKSIPNGGSYPDYVELRNNSGTNISLAGCALTDDPLNPTKFLFPANTTITPGGYMLVWCDKDTNAPGLHSGFELNADGETLLLLKGSSIVDSVAYGLQAPDVSIGRIVNGTGGWQATTPTPLSANSVQILGDLSKLRVNEWMADPAYGEDWFEIFNTDTNVLSIGGIYLSDTPSVPMITQVPALSFIAGQGFIRFWADGSSGGGPHANFKLAKGGESIVLTAPNGATTIDTITFGSQTTDVSQGRLPDGGNTIVSFSSKTASPEKPNWLPAPVYINELLAHASSPFEAAIEVFNPATTNVDIGGWWLSDDVMLPRKFQIAAGTIMTPDGFKVLYAADLAGGAVPFTFNPKGGDALLSAVDNTGALTGYASLVHFGPVQNNVSFGRINATGLKATSGGAEFWPLVAHTFGQDAAPDVTTFRTGTGASNAVPRIGPVIINEINYHPKDLAGGADDAQDEYIELFNVSSGSVDLNGWRLRGDSDYLFPTNAVLPAEGYLLLVSFDPTNSAALASFRATNKVSIATAIYGPYSPKLANSTHNIELAAPGLFDGTPIDYLVDKVEYRDTAPWPTSADGGGKTLQRINSAIIANNAANWVGANGTAGAVNSGVPLSITTASLLPGGVVGTPYTNVFTATSGTPPYNWVITAGSVPGLSLASNGTLSGTPNTVGTNVFTVQVTDSAASPATATKTFTLIVQASGMNITTTSPLPNGAVGVPYSQTLNATGGITPYTWSASAGNLPPGVTISSSGVLSGTPAQSGSFSFTARVVDSAGLVAQATLSLTVNNTPPTITGIPNQTINEDTSTAALGFTIGDAESDPASLGLTKASSNPTLVPVNNIVFGGSGANRTVTVTPAANQNGTATITITVSDGQYSVSTNFVLTVNPVNDPPTISALADQNITVNGSAGPLNFTVNDLETPAASLTLSATSSNPSLVPVTNIVFGFNDSGTDNDRTVTVTPAAGQSGTATITVTASDGTDSASSSFVLRVGSPGLVAAYSFNEGSGTTVADASGNNNGGTLSGTTWNIAGKYGSALSFSGTSARVTIADAPSLRLTNAMTLEAWVNPSTVSAAWRDVVYKGNDNYYLEGTSTSGGVPAAGGTFSTSGPLYATSVLTVNAWSHLAVSYDGATLRLYVNGTQVASRTQTGTIQTSANPLQIGGDSISGQTFQGLIDEVRVYNRALSAAEIQTDMNTAIGAAQNTAPTISAVNNQTVNQNTSTAAIPFTVGDAETAPGSLVVSGNSSNPTLVPNANIVFGGSGANRTVTVTPAVNQTGSATITLTVSDGALTTSTSFVLTVISQNTPPTITSIAPQTIDEDTSTAALGFTVGDAETAPGSLTLTKGSSNPTLVPTNNIVLGGSGANRSVTVSPAANQNGSATITLTVSDGQLSTNASFTVTVNPVNDPPTISAIPNQTISVNGTAGPIGFTIGDIDTAVGSLSLSADSSNSALVPTNNISFGGSGGNRTVTITPAADATGSATITVTVSDGQSSANTSFILTVSTALVGTRSFTNATSILIPSQGAATPYPSVINVSGMGGVLSNMTVTLYNVAHQRMRDVDILLVGPLGQKAIALSDVGPGGNQTSVTLTLSDAAASFLGTATLVSGTYKPTEIAPADTFAAPAPAGPYATNFAAFNAQSPNGSWSLYIMDDSSGSTGSIAGGWSVTVTTATAPPTLSSIPNQTIPVDGSTGPLNFTIGDADTPLASLALSANSSNPALVPAENIVLGGSGSNRTVTVTPVSGQSGSATITLTVSDGSNSASSSFVLTVTPPASAALVAAYSFNEGSGTTVSDASGNGNGGTLSGTTWNASGKFGSALSFGGTAARVTIADAPSLRLTSAMTLEAWVNPSTVTAAWRDVIYKGNDNYYLEGTSSSGGVPAAGGTFSSSGPIYATSTLPVNTWSHLAVTYDGATMRLYVNGTQVASRAQTGAIQTSTNPLQIGGDSLYGQTFQGLIDEVRVYNQALSAAEIQADMNSPLGGASPAAPQFISTENPPKITSITLDQRGVRITVSGEVGFSYALEASDDLVNWTEVAAQDNTTGTIVFQDQPTTNMIRFYRAVRAPE